jgi:hypothetical protein
MSAVVQSVARICLRAAWPARTHPPNPLRGCGGRGGRGKRLRWGEEKGARARLLRPGVSPRVRPPMRVGAPTPTNFFLLCASQGTDSASKSRDDGEAARV